MKNGYEAEGRMKLEMGRKPDEGKGRNDSEGWVGKKIEDQWRDVNEGWSGIGRWGSKDG